MATLLAAAGLPLEGLADARELLVAREAGAVIGCAAIEIYEDGGLLRSVAVAPAFRGTGLGRTLVEAALTRAQALNLPAVFLLTTTAERYFPRFGFEAIERDAVPDSVRRSVEFTSACPSTAVVMRKRLAST
jgi:amino-acid N-acetyltransferase